MEPSVSSAFVIDPPDGEIEAVPYYLKADPSILRALPAIEEVVVALAASDLPSTSAAAEAINPPPFSDETNPPQLSEETTKITCLMCNLEIDGDQMFQHILGGHFSFYPFQCADCGQLFSVDQEFNEHLATTGHFDVIERFELEENRFIQKLAEFVAFASKESSAQKSVTVSFGVDLLDELMAKSHASAALSRITESVERCSTIMEKMPKTYVDSRSLTKSSRKRPKVVNGDLTASTKSPSTNKIQKATITKFSVAKCKARRVLKNAVGRVFRIDKKHRVAGHSPKKQTHQQILARRSLLKLNHNAKVAKPPAEAPRRPLGFSLDSADATSCCLCGKYYASGDVLFIHQRTSHPVRPPIRWFDVKEKGCVSFGCSFCNNMFTSILECQEHAQLHYRPDTFKCVTCRSVLRWDEDLEKHGRDCGGRDKIKYRWPLQYSAGH